MPDSVKFLIYEKNGSELSFPEEKQFIPSEMPFSDVAYVSDNVKDAILETAGQSGQSRFTTTYGYDSQVNTGRWLEIHRGNPSNENPFVATDNCRILSMSGSTSGTPTSSTFTLFKNGVSADTLVFTGGTVSYTLTTPVILAPGDYISIQKTSGDNLPDVNVYVHIKVDY